MFGRNQTSGRRYQGRRGVQLNRLMKKVGYNLIASSLGWVLALAVLAGLACMALYGGTEYYENKMSAKATISLVYPEIVDGAYPDGSRFTPYSLIAEDRVGLALAQMQAEGLYTDFTAEELLQQITVTAQLENAVKETVSEMQSEGNNYTYFANEYKVNFTQPHVGERVCFAQLHELDYSREFLQRLMDIDARIVDTELGGIDGFCTLTSLEMPAGLDYQEQLTFYRAGCLNILRYLRSCSHNAGGFLSQTTGKSISDLVNLFNVMNGERLDQIKNYLSKTGVARDRENTMNKLALRLENENLLYHKECDKVDINSYAKDAYDHTFTENLIIVATSDDYGLYQARPKTVFDTVVNQYNRAINDSIQYKANIQEMEQDMELYRNAAPNSEDYRHTDAKCRELLAAYDDDYHALCDIARQTVADYLQERNVGYLSYKVSTVNFVTPRFLVMLCIYGGIGFLAVVMVNVLLLPLLEQLRVRRRMRRIYRIRNAQRAERAKRNAARAAAEADERGKKA